MTLLDDIVDGASSNTTPVTTLLRKVKVLASRLGTVELDNWVEHELLGYPDDVDLPPYRGPFKPGVVGSVRGAFGRGWNNAPIPPSSFPAEWREGHLFNVTFSEPISTLEELSGGSEALHLPWPADAIAATNALIKNGDIQLYQECYLVEAHRPISQALLAGVVDAVQTRVLDLALALERDWPTAGEVGGIQPPAQTIQNFVSTHIYGGAANVAVGGTQVTQQVRQSVEVGSRASLLSALSALGLRSDLLGDLEAALDEDAIEPVPSQPREPGPAVSRWLGRVALAGGGALSGVAIGASGDVVAELVKAYFGI